jgi:glycosyltransferase involved in cell wall biosynthesis
MQENKLKLMFLYADDIRNANVSQWRSRTPADSINITGGGNILEAQVIHLNSAARWRDPEVDRLIGTADIIIMERNVFDKSIMEAMDRFRLRGQVVLVDLDDHYTALPPINPAHQYWVKGRSGLPYDTVEGLIEGVVNHSDGVVSPSKVLLESWKRFDATLPVFHLPNFADPRSYRTVRQKQIGAPDVMFEPHNRPIDADVMHQLMQDNISAYLPSWGNMPARSFVNAVSHLADQRRFDVAERDGSERQIIIGWGGSSGHLDSFYLSNIVPALEQIIEETDNVMIKICGGDTRIIDGPLGNVPKDRIIHQGYVNSYTWPLVVSTFDVGIAPLELEPIDDFGYSYDEHRSWIKVLEYMMAGVPFIATNGAPYQDKDSYIPSAAPKLMANSFGHLVENTQSAWYNKLRQVIDNLSAEKEKMLGAMRHARQNLTAFANQHRYIAFAVNAMKVKQTRQLPSAPATSTYQEMFNDRQES